VRADERRVAMSSQWGQRGYMTGECCTRALRSPEGAQEDRAGGGLLRSEYPSSPSRERSRVALIEDTCRGS
jgi:hypothetical protein